MAKVTETRISVAYREGFVYSYSSAEITLGETLELEPGDKASEIREDVIDRLVLQAVDETRRIKKKYDKPEIGERPKK